MVPKSISGTTAFLSARSAWGIFWLIVMTISSFALFQDGIRELSDAWSLPEYSHGPLIPVLSALLFLRQLKSVPIDTATETDRKPGIILFALSLCVAFLGALIQIGDIVAYAMILWVGAVLLIGFGWQNGRKFWPSVAHLIYMLPLPVGLYYGVSIYLQGVSSELGVYFLQKLQVPVFLEGNIIDLGVYNLHVAEACSGLRYLFPILSFSYIFAVLYKGPTWHKAVLLLAAAPITVLMNSVRIALAGLIVDTYGIEYVEGFSHFFEGWVIFVACIGLLFLLAGLMLRLQGNGLSFVDALDLDTSGLWSQATRIRHIQPSAALKSCAVTAVAVTVLWTVIPQRDMTTDVARDPFALFPTQIGDWRSGPARSLEPEVEQVLAASDYYSAELWRTGKPHPVDVFIAWYADQSRGGVHSPEVCLPGGGWEIAQLEQIAAPVENHQTFSLNRAIIQRGRDRMLVYYWFEQQGQRTASGLQAKLQLLKGKIITGRNDSALVRLITPIQGAEEDGLTQAESRLDDAMQGILMELPRFVPGRSVSTEIQATGFSR